MNPAATVAAVIAIVLAACAGCEVGRREERRKFGANEREGRGSDE